MIDLKPWVTLIAVLVGNCGFWLACFNRMNASGLPRIWTKRGEKLLVTLCFTLPAFVFIAEATPLLHWLTATDRWWPEGTVLFSGWATFSLLSALLLGPIWLESRRWILPPPNFLSCNSEHFRVSEHVDKLLTGTRFTQFLDRIPGNEITQLEVNRKEILLARPIAGVDGLKIGHISDLHFTGQMTPDFYHFALDHLLKLRPDLIAITGDIIDYQSCLPWIEPLLGRLRAPLGVFFLLGNHDKRLGGRISELTDCLSALGHIDVGVADCVIKLESGASLYIAGNELPWLERHAPSAEACQGGVGKPRHDVLRLGLSHSPDQIRWARSRQLDLLLAGHTHGGQVRLPGIGPLVSPSHYGSRFASGLFYRAPTLMHVSRGLAGTHPLRWRCPPEVSLLTLSTPQAETSASTLLTPAALATGTA